MRHTREYYVEAYRRGYRITREGRLINPNGDYVNGFLIKCKNVEYLRFGIRINKKTKHLSVHILQAYQKYGEFVFEVNIVVRHKNNISTDNSWDNILIGSHKDNSLDMSLEFRSLTACKSRITLGCRVLSDKEIDEIRMLSLQGNLTIRQIASMYNCKSYSINNILSKKRRIVLAGI